ncbi:MAG: hypothetical protein IH951_14740 [Bacteroidetes bacterium]|nr:hypothetical protein [Bacteroidota bacterium]
MKTSPGHIVDHFSKPCWVIVIAFCLLSGCNNLDGLIENMPRQSLTLITGSYEISGLVVDAATGDPIQGVEISTGKSAFQVAKSDSLGAFRLKLRGYSQQINVRQVIVSKRGYETKMLVYSGLDTGTIFLKRSSK